MADPYHYALSAGIDAMLARLPNTPFESDAARFGFYITAVFTDIQKLDWLLEQWPGKLCVQTREKNHPRGRATARIALWGELGLNRPGAQLGYGPPSSLEDHIQCLLRSETS